MKYGEKMCLWGNLAKYGERGILGTMKCVNYEGMKLNGFYVLKRCGDKGIKCMF